jgi:hypothetical protein
MIQVIALFTVLFCLSYSNAYADSDKTQSNKLDNSAAIAQAMAEVKLLSGDIQNLKLEVIAANKDLLNLEEDLLYPSSTKYSVFVSMNSGQYFTLESVKLKLDGKLVTTHLYNSEDREALARGGVHKLFITNLSEGDHIATVFFTGLGPNTTPFKRATELSFKKSNGQGFLEIAINDNGAIQESEFIVKQW